MIEIFIPISRMRREGWGSIHRQTKIGLQYEFLMYTRIVMEFLDRHVYHVIEYIFVDDVVLV